eukprot:scaffold187400_cov33-Tisochrysis_lutea.AAC.3
MAMLLATTSNRLTCERQKGLQPAVTRNECGGKMVPHTCEGQYNTRAASLTHGEVNGVVGKPLTTMGSRTVTKCPIGHTIACLPLRQSQADDIDSSG